MPNRAASRLRLASVSLSTPRPLESGLAIEVRGLTHSYRSDGRELRVLGDLDFNVEPGGYTSITGASGAGKTTLLTLLGGLEPPHAGCVQVGSYDLRLLSGDDLAAYRRSSVGFVFQHSGLLETLTALENVELAFTLSGTSQRRRRHKAKTLLSAVGLSERAIHQPAQLSGGERQRVAIARALANRPGLVLADEPTGNLDEASAERVVALLEELHATSRCTLVLITHNPSIAARADQRLLLTGGKLTPA